MNQNELLKQMLDFNKSAFENALQTMTMLQEQAERVADSCLEQVTVLPKEGKMVVDEWRQACKKGRETFKNSMDESFKQVETFFAELPKGE